MASYEVNAYGAEVKVRDPGIVVLFFFLTLGFLIYPQVWYYRINRELRDFGRVYRDEKLADSNPVLSVLAVTLGALLIIPPIVSWWKCTGRIRRAQGIAQEPSLINGWLIFAMYVGMIVFSPVGLGIPAYVQSGLNGIWRKYPAVEAGGAVAQVTARRRDRCDGHAARAAEDDRDPVAARLYEPGGSPASADRLAISRSMWNSTRASLPSSTNQTAALEFDELRGCRPWAPRSRSRG